LPWIPPLRSIDCCIVLSVRTQNNRNIRLNIQIFYWATPSHTKSKCLVSLESHYL
jgi:hypothetical protein